MNIDRSPSLILDRIPGAKAVLRRAGFLAEGHMTKWPDNVKVHDVRKGLPVQPASVEAIYSSHMLEHIYFDEANAVLRECHRALRGGGVLRLALPDGVRTADLAAADGMAYNRELNAHPLTAPTGRARVTAMWSGSSHRWQPTPVLIETMLRDAGFVEVAHVAFLEGTCPDLEQVESRPDSLFVEAIR
jgi:predicted SAM-dependent methyltransferase